MKPWLSVVISTYNRSKMLTATIESILQQKNDIPFELIVVDNNSTDDTAEVIHNHVRQTSIVRYLFESKQGVSYGRNAGIVIAESDLIAFTDDDVVPAADWIRQIHTISQAKPEYGCIGGKVLPRWPAAPPVWLTEHHWAPLALLDYGAATTIDSDHRRCLITANICVRRKVFEEIGYFLPAFQKTKGSTCSIEDRELQERYWKVGGRCWFDPALVVYADIQQERLLKSYHRHWHYAHGQLHALLRDEELEKSEFRLFDIPGHIYRRFVTESTRYLADFMTGKPNEAFGHEIEARFCAGFIAKRIRAIQEKRDVW